MPTHGTRQRPGTGSRPPKHYPLAGGDSYRSILRPGGPHPVRRSRDAVPELRLMLDWGDIDVAIAARDAISKVGPE